MSSFFKTLRGENFSTHSFRKTVQAKTETANRFDKATLRNRQIHNSHFRYSPKRKNFWSHRK